MNFIGREKELRKILNKINDQHFTFSLIYGRRRVGKSELVKQALKMANVNSIYYECKQVSEQNNVSSLSGVFSSALGFPKMGYANMEEFLRFVFEYSKDNKLVLVLDEYPYLKETIPGIDSILQSLIDEYKDESKLSLFILGSYVEIMKSLLEHSNPLYGRVDLSINLTPMDYFESSKFYPNYSDEDKIRIYSVFGGIPYYNRLIDDTKSVRENIVELIASEDARLENEVSMYINSEMSKIVNANEVFETLAKGYSKYSDILSQGHVSSGPTLVDVLDKLIKMEMVEKVFPINDSNNKRKVSYRIKDNLCSFYYRFIFPHMSQLKILDSDVFYEKYIRDDFEMNYVPHQFETICKQYLIRLNKSGLINPPLEEIGKYYYDDPLNHMNGEFDIVSKDENGYIFYEVKFKKNPIAENEIEKEIEQVNKTNLACYKYVFISRSGFECSNMNNVVFLNIKDIFKCNEQVD